MLEPFIKELAGPAGGVIAATIIVRMFLNHLRDERAKSEVEAANRAAAEKAEAKERREFIERLSHSCHTNHTENVARMTIALDNCARTQESATVMLARVKDVLDRNEKRQNQKQHE